MQPAMISLTSFAEKNGYKRTTLALWCQKGLVPGAVKTPYRNSSTGYAYLIPEDAIPIRIKRGRPRAICDEPERAPYPYPAPKPKRKYTKREAALYIRRHAGDMTYAQLMEELDMPREEIRRIYERLHKRYGI